MGIGWEFADGRVETYALGTGVSLEPYEARQRDFRRNLIGWFGGMTAAMLLVIGVLMRLVLRPVASLEQQVRDIEMGPAQRAFGPLSDRAARAWAHNLNALIDTERRRQVRYRNTLDDLAHSLKTPLAVMRSLLEDHGRARTDADDELLQAVERMDERVGYQLRKARASGATGLGMEPVAVTPILSDLILSLDKVYRDKRIEAELDASPDAKFMGDRGDLTELAGNLLENAYKYGQRRVRVTAARGQAGLRIVVEDDGPGIPDEEVERILERGVRADESVPGQGIGLAVVREIVGLYQGHIEIGTSEWDGARIEVTLRRASEALLANLQ